jgi:hypothetical protein
MPHATCPHAHILPPAEHAQYATHAYPWHIVAHEHSRWHAHVAHAHAHIMLILLPHAHAA